MAARVVRLERQVGRQAQAHAADVVRLEDRRRARERACRGRSATRSAATIACTVAVPCLTSTRAPDVSGRASSWKSSASTSRRRRGQCARGDDHGAARRIEVVGELAPRPTAARPPRRRRRRRPAIRDGGGDARREDLDAVADADDARRDAPGHRAVVAQALGLGRIGREVGGEPALRAQHDLHRQAQRLELLLELVGAGQRLEQRQQRGTVVPGRALGARRRCCRLRAPRPAARADPGCRARPRRLRPGPRRAAKASSENPIRSILFTATMTCGTRSSATTARWRRVCSSTPLRPSTSTIDGIRRRGAGDHVARVLHVAGAVGEDERALAGGEVAVGHIDRDALLALGAQAVGEQREVEVAVRESALGRGALHLLELVGQDRLRVVQQPPDERRLAVVDGARRGEPEAAVAASRA